MQRILFPTYALLFTSQDDLQLVSSIGISILQALARLAALCNELSARRVRRPGGANRRSQGPTFALRARFTATRHTEWAERWIDCTGCIFLKLGLARHHGLFVHWCGALEHIGDVDDGALMLPSMWSIDSSTISQAGAEEALCWVERKDAG
jgi:hypothetical protein